VPNYSFKHTVASESSVLSMRSSRPPCPENISPLSSPPASPLQSQLSKVAGLAGDVHDDPKERRFNYHYRGVRRGSGSPGPEAVPHETRQVAFDGFGKIVQKLNNNYLTTFLASGTWSWNQTVHYSRRPPPADDPILSAEEQRGVPRAGAQPFRHHQASTKSLGSDWRKSR